MWSQPHERLWPPLLKLNLEMVGKLVSAAVAVAKSSIPVFNSNSNSNSRDFNSNSIFNSTNFNSNSWIGIELQFQFRNCIDPNPVYVWIGIHGWRFLFLVNTLEIVVCKICGNNIKLEELGSQWIGTSDNVSALSWTAPPWFFIHCGSSVNLQSLIYN